MFLNRLVSQARCEPCSVTIQPVHSGRKYAVMFHACRKRALLQHLHATQQRLLRLAVVSRWTHKSKAVGEVGLLGLLHSSADAWTRTQRI